MTERPRKKRSRGGGPWGVPLRSAACVCIFLGLFLGRFVSPRIIPAEYATNPIVVGLRFLTGGAVVLGILLTVVSVVGATLSFLTGNLRAFTSENPSDRLAWISACVLTALVFGATYMSYRFGTLRAGFAGISPTASAPGQGPVIDPAAEAAAAQARVDEMRMRGAMFQRPDGPGSLSHRPHGPLIPRGAPFGGPQ